MPMPNVRQAFINLTAVQLRHAAGQLRIVGKAFGRFGRRLRRQQEILSHAPQQIGVRVRRGRAAIVRTGNQWTRFDDHVLKP